MKTNIAIIGFMGSGKTAVAKELAPRLGKALVSIDRHIEERAGKQIAKIFAEDGEIQFRALEIETVAELARQKNQVLDCGGGVVINQINIARLQQDSVIVYLTASPSVLLKRLGNDFTTRPLLADAGRREQKLAELLQFRRPLYEAAADITINTSNLDLRTVLDKIVGHPMINDKSTGWNF